VRKPLTPRTIMSVLPVEDNGISLDPIPSTSSTTTAFLFVCLLLNGTSALFRPLVPRLVKIEHTNHVKNDLKYKSN